MYFSEKKFFFAKKQTRKPFTNILQKMGKKLFLFQKKIRDFLGFSFIEMRSFWVLSCIIFVCAILPVILANFENKKTFQKIVQNPNLDTLLAQISPLDSNQEEGQTRFRVNKYNPEKYAKKTLSPLFTFDPNTITASQWQEWGISRKVAQNIRKYIDKGGKFRKNEDVKKVYNFRDEWYERLAPYMIIAQDTTKTEKWAKTTFKKDSTQQNKKTYKKVIFDINLADTAQLNKVKGIGEKTALSIIKYREKLGGFTQLSQLKEVFLLKNRPDVLNNLLSCVTLDIENVRKIKINEIEYEALKNHPYIQGKLARIIINYRQQHGRFEKGEDLQKIKVLADTTYQKILPYLEF